MLIGSDEALATNGNSSRGASSVAAIIISTPRAARDSLSWRVCALMRRIRSSGSPASTGRSTIHDDTRLPKRRSSSLALTFTGAETRNLMRSGRTWRRSRNSRMAPVATASTTSLMVQSRARRTDFVSSSDVVSQSKRRCGLSAPLSGVSDRALKSHPSISASARPRVATDW
jgi:hypothetical protein